MAYIHQIHHTDPGYAPPLVRPPSPADTVGSLAGPDETTYSDHGLPDDDFGEKIIARLRLREPTDAEVDANRSVLLPKPKTAEEERLLHEHVMVSLRAQVRMLEENELFERALLEPVKVAQEPLPSSNDIDTLMRGMMGYSSASPTTAPAMQHDAILDPHEPVFHFQPDFDSQRPFPITAGPPGLPPAPDFTFAPPILPLASTHFPDANGVHPPDRAAGRQLPNLVYTGPIQPSPGFLRLPSDAPRLQWTFPWDMPPAAQELERKEREKREQDERERRARVGLRRK